MAITTSTASPPLAGTGAYGNGAPGCGIILFFWALTAVFFLGVLFSEKKKSPKMARCARTIADLLGAASTYHPPFAPLNKETRAAYDDTHEKPDYELSSDSGHFLDQRPTGAPRGPQNPVALYTE